MAAIKHDWNSEFPTLLEHEKLMHKNVWAMYYGINTKGKTRLSRNPLAQLNAYWEQQLENNQVEDAEVTELLKTRPQLTYWKNKLIKATTILAWFVMPSSPQKAGAIVDAAYERYYEMADADFDWERQAERPLRIPRLNYRYLVKFLASILEPAYHRIHDLYLRVTSDQRGSRIIIALRRYKNKTGTWPENLDAVKSFVPEESFIDPINAGPFEYRLSEEDFTLYSKGKNIDYPGDDIQIWPPKGSDQEKGDPNDK